ncbi:GAF domain-containing protein [bacterium]|nr:GAF domain-containing protein [bacterium]
MESELQLKLQKMEMLLDISRTLAAFETLDEMLSKLVEITTIELNAERGTIFLNDSSTGELYSRVAQGNFRREIRVLNNIGVAGHVFTSGQGRIVHDAYKDEFFNPDIDKQTGYVTRSILCVPIRTARGDIIGVAQALNKKEGQFTEDDMTIMGSMTTQAAVVLQSAQFIEQLEKNRAKEMEFVDVVSDITSEIDLGSLLQKVMAQATKMLNAERSTLFLNDEKRNELFSRVGEGLGAQQIRLPNHLGIAGNVFTSGKTINIPHAYADLRFNPSFDKKTGFFTRSILCTPVINKAGKIIGVTQVLNRRGGPFTDEDESRLKAFTAQVSIALENAKLFDDIQNMKNYNEGILESMSNAVMTLSEDGKIITCNSAGYRIMGIRPEDILDNHYEKFFTESNTWLLEKISRVEETQTSDVTMDADLMIGEEKLSVNVTILPLISIEQKKLGTMIMIEDISSEKRMKSTMSRYMDPGLADQLLGKGEDILGGKSTVVTVLFSDIRSFTTLTEELGAQGTVSLLNEYFTIMVDCVLREGGMLDKFIGDALMAAFGMPIPHSDDEDRAVRGAISMIRDLNAWNIIRAGDGHKPVNIGIGLNTDMVVSGNIGSPKRMDYTLIGDGVNLASRLESACKQYFARILISDNTYRKLRGTYRTREIDRVVVKGKTEPVSIHEVLDYHDDQTFPNLMSAVNYFTEGLGQYREGKWDGAMKAFSEALRLNPQDKLTQMYIDRCCLLKDNPPCGDWDGVWKMTSK